MSVLPVSVIAVPLADDEAAAAGDDDDDDELPELLQAAASTVSGIRAAAVQSVRIGLATGKYSFVFSHARARIIQVARGCVR
jgi:hypothetical protein